MPRKQVERTSEEDGQVFSGRFRFTVRDFTFDEKALANERDKIRELETEKQKLHANLVRWLKINFGEVFSASVHIKALRVFVESVLR